MLSLSLVNFVPRQNGDSLLVPGGRRTVSINNRYYQINLRFLQNKWKDVKGIWDSAMGRSLLFRSSTELPSNSRQGKYKSACTTTNSKHHIFPGQNPLMILRYRSYYCVSHFFFFRPLCFISPFPRFISSPRAAPAKVASLLISPRAQSAMSPRSQGGCNCELQKKNQQTNDKF